MKKLLGKILWKRRIKAILEQSQGGVFKRIDEHRELIQHIQQNAPQLLESVAVINWLRSQDQFLNELASTAIIEKSKCVYKPRKGLPRRCALVHPPRNPEPDHQGQNAIWEEIERRR